MDEGQEPVKERIELHAEICSALQDRQQWEQKQITWYEMRHDGLERKRLPWPDAADLHWPLADTLIGQFKPFYNQQIFSFEQIADFTPLSDELKAFSVMAGYWFSDRIRNKSNLRRESVVLWDKMLQAGQVCMKTIWDVDKSQLRYDAVDPMNVILPFYTEDVQDADWLVHVIVLSVDAYKRNKNYEQNKDFVKSICGRGTSENRSNMDQVKYQREGFTYSEDKNRIVLWERYKRNDDGQWLVETYSPVNPMKPVREEYILDYEHGENPFVLFEFEVKDKSVYSSRGIPEMVAMEESYLNKIMNEKADSMTMLSRPIYTCSSPIPNIENYDLAPGSILPGDIKAIVNPPPPVDFDREAIAAQNNASNRVGSPNFGINQSIEPGKTEPKTATEIEKIAGLSAINIDLRSSITRDSLTRLYKQSWALLIQFDKDNLEYFYMGEMRNADKKALVNGYRIQPTGSIDGLTRQQLYQKAVARKQLFGRSPFVRQDELDRTILEVDDPRLVEKLWLPQNAQQANQVEAQGEELAVMLLGIPVEVKPGDDDRIHLETTINWLGKVMGSGIKLDPQSFQLIGQHSQGHINKLKTIDKAAAKQYASILKQIYAPSTQQIPQQVGGAGAELQPQGL